MLKSEDGEDGRATLIVPSVVRTLNTDLAENLQSYSVLLSLGLHVCHQSR